MADSFICPFCNMSTPFIKESVKYHLVNFDSFVEYDHKGYSGGGLHFTDHYFRRKDSILFHFHKCSNSKCLKTHIFAEGIGADVAHIQMNINPKFSCKSYPDYIPQVIREDYQEACEILHSSPKASATLARRCMQGIIRGFWGEKKDTLNQEINAIKGKIDPDIWQALHDLRTIGNIGAHPEQDINLIVDIEPDEAKKLVRLIELLIEESYIAKHNRTSTLESISAINSEKQEQRNPTSN